MSEVLRVDLFAEDRAHEEFLKPLIQRLAREEECEIQLAVRSARGGHGRAIEEFRAYQRIVSAGYSGLQRPDVVCVAIDANCQRWTKKREEIAQAIEEDFKDRVVVACPDPHIERWFLADPDAFYRVVGARSRIPKRKCERDGYKCELARAVTDGGHPPTLGGIEFAAEIVAAMDFYRAGKNEPSLRYFIDKVRQHFKRT